MRVAHNSCASQRSFGVFTSFRRPRERSFNRKSTKPMTSSDGVDSEVIRTGTCFCEHSRVTVTGEPVAVSICHCSNCRKLSGAPFSIQALCKADQVKVEHEGDVLSTASSANVDRCRCVKCGSPIYASLMKVCHSSVTHSSRVSVITDSSTCSFASLHSTNCSFMLRHCQGKMTAVPLTILNTPGASNNLKPTHHMYYGDRIFDVNDDLPKFVKSKGELWTPDKDVAVDES